MKAFFKDIFEYHHHYNQKLAGQLITHETLISEKTIPLFSHAINAHQIWNSRILQTKPVGVHQLHSLERCKALDNSNYRNTLKILNSFALEATITYQNSAGDIFNNSIREILFHIANHFTHHRGQIVSDLREHGIVPIKTDYIFYKR